MKRGIFPPFLIFWALLLAGCGTVSPSTATSSAGIPTATASTTAAPTTNPTATPTPPPTSAPGPQPDLSLSAGGILIYPVAPVYGGERVTFEVLAHVPDLIAPRDVGVSIFVNEQLVVQDRLNGSNLGGDGVGLFPWVWTAPDVAGTYTVTVTLDPQDVIRVGDEDAGNNQATHFLQVATTTEMPASVANAAWIVRENNCCRVHVVSGTAAERDLNDLLTLTDEAVAQAASRLEEQPNNRLNVYLVDRVIGQGGYSAGPTLVVSYLDRDYAGTGLREVLVHEAVHAIDSQFAPKRITFLAEGVAVWATGGHYKTEPLDERTAALVELDRYVPLAQLINDFYPHQHEIGYLEAAGFISYLVNQYGWPDVRAFYASVSADIAPTQADAVDMQLQAHFGTTLAQLEVEWLAYLGRLRPQREIVTDLATTIRYFDTMRRYQSVYDPTAYFLTAWLPAPQQAEERGITADLTRHPEEEVNVTLETMLGAADEALRAGNYNRANVILDSVERVLDYNGDFLDPLANNYRNIVRTLHARGYTAQQIDLRGSRAIVQASLQDTIHLRQILLTLNNSVWSFAQ
ncbi:MAG: hypothetical protein KC418_15990 [Anaerolineales bacterium]|nr:hypothetical protein [Anaerolineales bacterium]MCB8950690.1 hypothetical protein [Ardenticatenales bacterium]